MKVLLHPPRQVTLTRLDANVVRPTYKAMPKWKAHVMVFGRGLSLSGFEDGSRGGVVDSSMKAKTVLEDSLKG